VKILSLMIASILLASCSGNDEMPPLWAYEKPVDMLKSATYPYLGFPCTITEKSHGIEIEMMAPADQCFRYGPPQKYGGIWLVEFEASHYLDGVTEAPKAWRWTLHTVDLDFADEAFRRKHLNAPRNAYYIEFTGRRMAYSFPDRRGGSTSSVIVDQISLIREVEAPKETLWCDPRCVPFEQMIERMRQAQPLSQ